MYERILANELTGSSRSILLLGPRQVGKSTLLASLKPDRTINLANPRVFRDFISQPERLLAELRAAPTSVRTIFLDEVQRVPPLLDVVQVLIDEDPKRFRFLLSGSSARKLRRGQANLLPGRVHRYDLHPLLAVEMGSDFVLERVLAHGSLPAVYSETNARLRERDLRSYTDLYLREEIQAEALVRNLGGYSRLLDLMAASSGRVLNIQALCRDADLRYETTRRYLEVCEDTLIVFRVPSWSGSSRASLTKHAKYFLFDLGVRNALLRRPLDQIMEDERGLLLEHVIAYELYRRVGGLCPQWSLFHYRTKHGAEVDFILETGTEVWAIEVKASRQISRSHRSGLTSFAQNNQVDRQMILFSGEHRATADGVEYIPVTDFLQELPASGH